MPDEGVILTQKPLAQYGPRVGVLFLLIGTACGAAAATATNTLPQLLALCLAGVLFLVGVRYPLVLLALLAALIPIEDALAFGSTGTATRIVGLVFALAYLANRRALPSPSTLPAAGWAFATWAVVSGVWAVDSAGWVSGIMTLIQLVVLALIAGDLVGRNPSAARAVMWSYSSTAVLTALILLLSGGLTTTGRAAAFADQDPAYFSAVLVPAFLFLVYESARIGSRPGLLKLGAIAVLVAAGVVAWAALVSGTRSSMVGLGAGLVVLTALGTGHWGGRIAVAAIGVAGVGVGLLAPGVLESVLARLSEATTSGGSGRQDIWAVGLTIFGQHPLVGVGYGGFPAAFTPEMIRMSAIPGYDLRVLAIERAPHSILVGTAAELGLVGLVLLGVFVWRILRAQSGSGVMTFARVAISAVLAQALFLDVLGRKHLWLLVGIALGLAAADQVRSRSQRPQPAPPATSPGQRADAGAGSGQLESRRFRAGP